MNRKSKYKNITHLALISLILFNLAFRYGRSPHEIGSDTFSEHEAANQIIIEGSYPWIINILSYFGMTPWSSSIGTPTIISCLSLVSNVSTEHSVLLLGLFISSFSVLSIYLMSNLAFRNTPIPLLSSFFFPLCFFMVIWSVWGFRSRLLFVILSPIFFFLFLRFYESRSVKFFTILLIFSFTMLSIHMMTVFLVLQYVIPLALILILNWFGLFNKLFASKYYTKNVTLCLYSIYLILGIYGFVSVTDPVVVEKRLVHRFGDSEILFLFNLVWTYTTRFHLFSSLLIIGFLSIFYSYSSNMSKKLFAMMPITTPLIISDTSYSLQFLMPIGSIYMSVGLYYIFTRLSFIKTSKQSQMLVIFMFLVLTILFANSKLSDFSSAYKNDTDYASNYIDEDTYDTSMYINTFTSKNQTVLLPSNYAGLKIETISDTETLSRISLISREGFDLSMRYEFKLYIPRNLEEKPYISNWEYEAGYAGISNPRLAIHTNHPLSNILVDFYEVKYAVDSVDLEGESQFIDSKSDEKYDLFENDMERIYFI